MKIKVQSGPDQLIEVEVSPTEALGILWRAATDLCANVASKIEEWSETPEGEKALLWLDKTFSDPVLAALETYETNKRKARGGPKGN